jgi:hypothetical protein
VASALAQEAAALALLVLSLAAWFAAWPAWLPPALPVGAGLGLTLVRFGPGALRALRTRRARMKVHLETPACLALAVAYRFPALVHPWGWVNKDGAFGAFIALHLLQGERPAPIFTEGANYQGSLKGHLAAGLALVTGSRDLSWLMVLASLLLYLVFVAASMALARRTFGRGAALVTGLYLALSPKFLTTFSLNCVGQYVDVLALGGVALALLARLLDDDIVGKDARLPYLGIGLLLGAAFWQQPVALAYIGAVGLALLQRRRTWSDPWTALVLLGFASGVLPVVLWNLQNAWATSDVVGRDPRELLAQAEALPVLVARTLTRAFPVLAGLSPGHPAAAWPGVHAFAVALLPLVCLLYPLVVRGSVRQGLRGRPGPALLPLLLATTTLGLFWATASGHINDRPRYLLPALAAFAMMLGPLAAWTWQRSRAVAAGGLLAVLALNVVGTAPRLLESAAIEAFWQAAVRSLEEKGIRTGYADFSVAAPITMFTAERITLSARLGPTPAYYSDRQDERVARDGPDAYVLAKRDDPEAFAAALHALGVTCRSEREPFPTFWDCSRRVRLDELWRVRSEAPAPQVEEE